MSLKINKSDVLLIILNDYTPENRFVQAVRLQSTLVGYLVLPKKNGKDWSSDEGVILKNYGPKRGDHINFFNEL